MFVLSGCSCQMIFFVRKWICRQAVSSTRNSSIPRLYEIKKSSGRLGSVQFVVEQIQPMHWCNQVLLLERFWPNSKCCLPARWDILTCCLPASHWNHDYDLWSQSYTSSPSIHACANASLHFLKDSFPNLKRFCSLWCPTDPKCYDTSLNSLIHPLIRPRQRRNVRCGNSRNWRKEEMKRDRPNMAKPLTIEPCEIKASHVYARKHRIAHCNAALRSHWNEKNVAHTSRTWWMDIVGFYSVSMPATCQVEELRKQMYLSGGKLSCEKHEDHRKCRNRRTSNWKGLLKLPLDCSILGGRSRQASKKPMRLQF